MRSIIQAFQDDKFRRVKIGVGKPAAGQSVDDYVLTPFPPEQAVAIDTANQTAADRENGDDQERDWAPNRRDERRGRLG